jgi:branched-chain amino acid transport system permease protein
MQLLATAIVTGLFLAGTYSLIALGMVLVFRATHTFNFAHGQSMLLAAYVVGKYFTADSSTSFVAYSLLACLIVGTTSAVFYLLVLRRLVGKSLFLAVIATLGYASVLDGVMGIMFKSQQYVIRNPYLSNEPLEIGSVRVQSATATVAVASLALAVAVTFVLQKTQLGIRVRAAGQSALLASQGGINVRRIYVMSWAASGVLAAIAGVAYGSTNVVGSSLAETAHLALPAMMLGGLDSFVGAIVGGLSIGLLQGTTASYFSGEHVEVVTYAVLLIVLLVRPNGLFGTKIIKRV